MVNLMWNKPFRKVKIHIRRFCPRWLFGPKACWARYRHLLLPHFQSAKGVDTSPQFEAGGKLVSVLLPSRGRPQGLFHAVSSLITRCNDPKSIEILLRLDDDDAESQKAVECMNRVFGDTVKIRCITGPRGGGYRDFHIFVEELCAVARGDFLLLFNDDTVMDTEGWDMKFAHFRNEFCVLRLDTSQNCHDNPFPAVHRKIHQVIGHFSKHAYCDAWMERISRRARILRSCHVRVTHKQQYENPDATAEGALSEFASLSDQRNSIEYKNLLNADLAKVKSYLDRHGVQLQRIESAS